MLEYIVTRLVWRSDGGTSMRDVVISDGAIVDETWVPTFNGGVAIGGEGIVAVGDAGR